MTDGNLGTKLLAGLGAGAGVVAVGVFWLAFAGIVWSPVVHQHCYSATAGPSQNLDLESGWTFRLDYLPSIDDTQPGRDGRVCVRNSPTREALSGIGIWELGTPAEQLGGKLGRSVEAQVGEGSDEYFQGVLALRQESDQVTASFLTALQSSDTRQEALDALRTVSDDSEALTDQLRELTPPESLAQFQGSLLAANEDGIEALDDLAAAVQFGSRADIQQEYAQFQRYARRTQSELKELVHEIQDDLP